MTQIGPKRELATQFVVEVSVADIDRSLAYYTALGFSVERRTGGFAVLRWDDHLLFLDEQKGLPPDATMRANLRILVVDVDRVWDLAQRLRLTVYQGIADRHYGLRDFTVVDPDGFGLRFASWLTDTRHA